ncbi:alpha/beta hydrolase [Bacillus seohaeanensis]|jgi:uncharacterized protein|uniref:Alpha/beta hydrolase n=1 Tax=Bacillus seohaeanensis TaxID=284580 RepID=A0ABW5RN63_9BACI
MKKWFTVVGGAAVATVGLGYYITSRFMYMRKKEDSLILQRETEALRFNLEEYSALPKQEIMLRSPYGYDIKTIFITANPGKKYMIFCHGVTENKFNSIKYMNLFLKRGFNAVIYDHRRHGESGGKTTSYGYFEKNDLKVVVDELIRLVGDDVFFGIHGESMGASTLLLYAGSVEDRADFYIADCPFSDFGEQLAYRMGIELKIPADWLLPLANTTLKFREGYTLKDISPISVVKNIQKPVLFIHSSEDTFIPPEMTQKLYRKKQGPKELYIDFKGSHAQSYNFNPKQYEQVIDQFLTNFVYVKEPVL